jgi:hypothetical protein
MDTFAVLLYPLLDMDNNTGQKKADSVLTEEITPPRISTGRSFWSIKQKLLYWD